MPYPQGQLMPQPMPGQDPQNLIMQGQLMQNQPNLRDLLMGNAQQPQNTAQQILSARFQDQNQPMQIPQMPNFQPSSTDIRQSAFQNQVGLSSNPNYLPTTPEQVSGISLMSAIKPESEMADLQSKLMQNQVSNQYAVPSAQADLNLKNAQAGFYNNGGMYGMKITPMYDPSIGTVRSVNAVEAMSNPNLISVDDPRVKQLVEAAQARGKLGVMPSGLGGSPDTSEGQPTQSPNFGFDNSQLLNNPNVMKLSQKNTADFEKSQQQREMLTNNIKSQIDVLRPQLQIASGGGYEKPLLQAGTFFHTDQGNAADLASSNTQALALNLSQLQQVGGSGRAMKAALMTLLNSKPDPYNHLQANNLSNLNHIESTVNQYDLETKFLDSYKDANPAGVIDTRAENLFLSLLSKYPTESVDPKSGLVTVNKDNIQALEDAIPDAIANPKKYMSSGMSAPSGGAKTMSNDDLLKALQ